MAGVAYTDDQIRDVKRYLDALESVSPEKRVLVAVAAEAFAAGLNAKDSAADGTATA